MLRKPQLLLIAGVLFTGYITGIVITWGRLNLFSFFLMLLGLAMIFAGLHFEKIMILKRKLPKIIRVCIKAGFCVLMLSFFIVQGIIISYMRAGIPENGADYVIILGSQVAGTVPSIPMRQRVSAALRYVQQNPGAAVVVTGGLGRQAAITEAEAMRRLLVHSGIGAERILLEDKSKNTVQNLKFSDELYALSGKHIVIVSSDFHIFRSLSIAKKLNYENVKGIPARSTRGALPYYLLREYAAVMHALLTRRI